MFGFGRHFDSLFPRSFFDHEMQMIDDFIDRDHDLFSAPLQPLWPSSFLALQPLPSSSSSSTQSSSSTTTSSTDSSSSSSSSDSSKQLAQQQDTQQSSNSLLSWRPSLKPIRVDVLDQKDKIVVKAEVPGLPKEQIKLNMASIRKKRRTTTMCSQLVASIRKKRRKKSPTLCATNAVMVKCVARCACPRILTPRK
eukprot:TRINITY_DN976_c0_g1_i2.p1 TRINITY_DN976_c0_g1~~TRINITY_DN976_c0_g1_i2.p1  ORF type:complete len:195 (-),score=61.95 TRINITY_DN976_c0_g1_i2:118-702(-)